MVFYSDNKAARKAVRRNILPFLKLLEKKVCYCRTAAFTYLKMWTNENYFYLDLDQWTVIEYKKLTNNNNNNNNNQ